MLFHILSLFSSPSCISLLTFPLLSSFVLPSLFAFLSLPDASSVCLPPRSSVELTIDVNLSFEGKFYALLVLVPQLPGVPRRVIPLFADVTDVRLGLDDSSPLDFGRLALGESTFMERRLTNYGTIPVDFTVDNPNPQLLVTPSSGILGPGMSVLLSFSFFPVDETPQVESLVIRSSSTAPITLAVNALGGTPRMRLSHRTRMDFGRVLVGKQQLAMLGVTNVGTAAMPLTNCKLDEALGFAKASPASCIPPQVLQALKSTNTSSSADTTLTKSKGSSVSASSSSFVSSTLHPPPPSSSAPSSFSQSFTGTTKPQPLRYSALTLVPPSPTSASPSATPKSDTMVLRAFDPQTPMGDLHIGSGAKGMITPRDLQPLSPQPSGEDGSEAPAEYVSSPLEASVEGASLTPNFQSSLGEPKGNDDLPPKKLSLRPRQPKGASVSFPSDNSSNVESSSLPDGESSSSAAQSMASSSSVSTIKGMKVPMPHVPSVGIRGTSGALLRRRQQQQQQQQQATDADSTNTTSKANTKTTPHTFNSTFAAAKAGLQDPSLPSEKAVSYPVKHIIVAHNIHNRPSSYLTKEAAAAGEVATWAVSTGNNNLPGSKRAVEGKLDEVDEDTITGLIMMGIEDETELAQRVKAAGGDVDRAVRALRTLLRMRSANQLNEEFKKKERMLGYKLGARVLGGGARSVLGTLANKVEDSLADPDRLKGEDEIVRMYEPVYVGDNTWVGWPMRNGERRFSLPIGHTLCLPIHFVAHQEMLYSGRVFIETPMQSAVVELSGQGRDALLLCEPASVDFSDCLVGTKYTTEVTLTNLGDVAYTVNVQVNPNAFVDGSSSAPPGSLAPLTEVPQGAFTYYPEQVQLAPYEKSKLILVFTPPISMACLTGLYLASAYSASTLKVSLGSGTVKLLASPSIVEFGNVQRKSKVTATLTLENVGSLPLNYRITTGAIIAGGIAVTGAAGRADRPEGPDGVVILDSSRMDADAHSQAVGHTGITAVSNTGGSMQQSATVAAVAAAVITSANARSVFAADDGTISISSLPFSLSRWSGSVPPHSSVRLLVKGAFTLLGPFHYELHIQVEGTGQRSTVAVAGVCQEAQLNTGRIQHVQFGNCLVGEEAVREIPIENQGDFQLEYETKAAYPVIATPASGTVPGKNTIFVKLSWIPANRLEIKSLVRIATNAGTVALYCHGRGAYPKMSLSTTSIDFGVCAVHRPYTQSSILKNVGPVVMDWHLAPPNSNSSNTLPSNYTIYPMSGTLQPGQSIPVTVTFIAHRLGPCNGSFTIVAKGGATDVSVSGIGGNLAITATPLPPKKTQPTAAFQSATVSTAPSITPRPSFTGDHVTHANGGNNSSHPIGAGAVGPMLDQACTLPLGDVPVAEWTRASLLLSNNGEVPVDVLLTLSPAINHHPHHLALETSQSISSLPQVSHAPPLRMTASPPSCPVVLLPPTIVDLGTVPSSLNPLQIDSSAIAAMSQLQAVISGRSQPTTRPSRTQHASSSTSSGTTTTSISSTSSSLLTGRPSQKGGSSTPTLSSTAASRHRRTDSRTSVARHHASAHPPSTPTLTSRPDTTTTSSTQHETVAVPGLWKPSSYDFIPAHSLSHNGSQEDAHHSRPLPPGSGQLLPNDVGVWIRQDDASSSTSSTALTVYGSDPSTSSSSLPGSVRIPPGTSTTLSFYIYVSEAVSPTTDLKCSQSSCDPVNFTVFITSNELAIPVNLSMRPVRTRLSMMAIALLLADQWKVRILSFVCLFCDIHCILLLYCDVHNN